MIFAINQTNNPYNTKPISSVSQGNSVIPPASTRRKPLNTINFRGQETSVQAKIRTNLATPEEKAKYSSLVKTLDKKDRKKLEVLLKNGILLNSNSNDNSTVLDNLYKISTEQRAKGLDPKVVLKETITTIHNPFVITQKFGDIPKKYMNAVLQTGEEKNGPLNPETVNVQYSGACVSASIEFNLAKQMPAEFTRFAEQLTSPKMAVEKTIKTKNLANNTLDAVWLLNAFKIPYKMDDYDNAKITLAPDKNAIIRAQIQNSNKDKLERSLVDVMMQSTFMNVGSQQSYNSLTDIREGTFNNENKGLIEFEKTFTESVVQDKNKVSVTYQQVDENGDIAGYETDFNTMKKHILDSLAIGENVIIGYTQTDDKNHIINGHEITIIGAKTEKNGKTTFICNDTDDNNPNPISYSEDYIIPKIHHAGLPQEIAEKDVKYVDTWVDGINSYKELRQKESQLDSVKQTVRA